MITHTDIYIYIHFYTHGSFLSYNYGSWNSDPLPDVVNMLKANSRV